MDFGTDHLEPPREIKDLKVVVDKEYNKKVFDDVLDKDVNYYKSKAECIDVLHLKDKINSLEYLNLISYYNL